MSDTSTRTYYWNTGSYYTKYGHRFTAQVVEDGVVFRDFDRGIWGHIPHAHPHVLNSPTAVERFVMSNYDSYNYGWDKEGRADKLQPNPKDEYHGGKAGRPGYPVGGTH